MDDFPSDEEAWFANYDARDPEINISERLAYLYVFADRFTVPELSHSVMIASFNRFRRSTLPQYSVVKFLFNNLPENDGYLRLVVDAYSHQWTSANDAEEEMTIKESVPTRFWIMVAAKLAFHREDELDELMFNDYWRKDTVTNLAPTS